MDKRLIAWTPRHGVLPLMEVLIERRIGMAEYLNDRDTARLVDAGMAHIVLVSDRAIRRMMAGEVNDGR